MLSYDAALSYLVDYETLIEAQCKTCLFFHIRTLILSA